MIHPKTYYGNRYVITGASDKIDGFTFVTEAESEEGAVAKLLTAINLVGKPKYKLMKDKEGKPWAVVDKEYDGDGSEWDDAPRWEGWLIYVGKVNNSGFVPGATHW